ncbi:MAG: type III toxin-antitoxin system ToxN/AbiQ family toxin [Lachnospiraceae bacterium]|nr:type III toxin-antitoxin system ToxN/AbiQ family toxin [Lachnospiraceae bacterium]
MHKYCILLLSSKEKHRKMKNPLDFSKFGINGKLFGVLNFNLIIPIETNGGKPVITDLSLFFTQQQTGKI